MAEIVEYDDVVVQGKACVVPDFLAFWFGEFFKEANTFVAEVSDSPPEESRQPLDVGWRRPAMYSRSGASGPIPSSDSDFISSESENLKTDFFPFSVKTALGLQPMNEYLPQLSTFSALSSRKHSAKLSSFAKVETGVSMSASNSA